MDIIKRGFGEQLKVMRKIKGLTQESLAERIGINLRQLARIEAGESFVSSQTLYKICNVLEVSPMALFNFDLEHEVLMTGTGQTLHLNVVKSGNVITFVPKQRNTDTDLLQEEDFESRMATLAQRLQKDINVTEIENGIEVCHKTFKPGGEIKVVSVDKRVNKFATLKE